MTYSCDKKPKYADPGSDGRPSYGTSDQFASTNQIKMDFGNPVYGETKTTLDVDGCQVNLKYLIEEDFKDGDLDTIAPGTYKWVFRIGKEYLGESLFGYTQLGTDNVVVRADLKGEAYRRVREHEVVGHNILGLGEEATRSLTGTHMNEFLPLYEKMKLRY